MWRNLFNGEAERPDKPLPGGTAVEVRDEVWRAGGARLLRITSPDPEVTAVLRFAPVPGAQAAPGLLRLTVILVARPGRLSYEYRTFGFRQEGQALQGGRLVPRTTYRVGEKGLETELAGEPGRVSELELQDDGQAELRLLAQGDVLEVQVVPPRSGGHPSGGVLPYYHDQTLAFLDYDVLLSGYRNNAYAEIWLGRTLALRANGWFGGSTQAVVGRAVITGQLWRNPLFSLWLEGGAAVWQVQETGQPTADVTATWGAGLTAHYRQGDWGAALNYATLNGPAVITVLGGWQATPWLGVVLNWQSFKGLQANGLGLSADF